MKLLLNHKIAADAELYLPPDVQVAYVTDGGIIEGGGSDAEVFFRWWSPGYRIDKVITHTLALRRGIHRAQASIMC